MNTISYHTSVIMNGQLNNVYSIPYSKLPYGSKIIIYGAGKVGKILIKNITECQRCELAAVIDSKYMNIEPTLGYKVMSPQRIKEIKYDFIIIAVENSNEAESITKSLLQMGVSEDVIIWNGSIKYTDEIRKYQEYEKFLKRNFEVKKQRFFIFMVPEHGNGGDYIISYSEKKFFSEYFPDVQVITVTSNEWINAKDELMGIVKPNDVIFVNGGGYIGDLWGDDIIYHSIIESFPLNKKFFFPNTLTYKTNELDDYLPFHEETKWFKKQSELYTFFRDRMSYELFSAADIKSALFPDMALINHITQKRNKRNQVMLCFRSDREKINNYTNIIKNELDNNKISYIEKDINYGGFISQEYGEEYIFKLFAQTQECTCMITDRLHGMIMATICDVPCISFDNSTHKIKSVYDWISSYVCFYDQYPDNGICKAITDAVQKKHKAGDFQPLKYEFDKMAQTIRQYIRKGDKL